jgi:hypothetical protein
MPLENIFCTMSCTNLFEISGVQYDRTSPGFKALARIAALCNRAEFKPGQDGVPILKK